MTNNLQWISKHNKHGADQQKIDPKTTKNCNG